MSVFKNIGIDGYFKRYGKKFGISRGVFMSNPFHIVKDYEMKKILYYRKSKKYLEKFIKYKDKTPSELTFKEIDFSNPIWIYWKQGFEKAPDIVKACVESVKKNCDQEIILLDDSNLNDFIEFPKYIIDKTNKGFISAAAFSDLIRLSLLEHFGGTWIDATVYLTGELPKYITDSDLFLFQDSFGLIENPAKIASWFIHCNPNNIIIKEARNMFFEYFKKQNHVIEYLLVYIFLGISFDIHNEDYLKMPYVNSEYCHLLFNNLNYEFDFKRFDYINELTKIHKLSYKLDDSVYDKKNNFYNYLISEVEK